MGNDLSFNDGGSFRKIVLRSHTDHCRVRQGGLDFLKEIEGMIELHV